MWDGGCFLLQRGDERVLNEPVDILKVHPVRKTKVQKEVFRSDVQTYVKELGYSSYVEEGTFGVRNLIIGDPQTAQYLVTAHYDTPASIGLPNILTPCNLLTYILWQFVMIGGLLTVALAGVFVTDLLTRNMVATLLVGYALYFGILFLMIFGPANKSNVNDNSSGVITLLEIARSMPAMHRNKVCFVLFDLEEAGLKGSASYRKSHKTETEKQVVLNLDCVGDGDHILFFPTKKAKKNKVLMQRIYRLGGWFGRKHIQLKDKGFCIYPSDQRNFPVGIGIAAFHKGKLVGYYCNKIHTKKDTILEETNVNLLRAALTTLICGDAVN